MDTRLGLKLVTRCTMAVPIRLQRTKNLLLLELRRSIALRVRFVTKVFRNIFCRRNCRMRIRARSGERWMVGSHETQFRRSERAKNRPDSGEPKPGPPPR